MGGLELHGTEPPEQKLWWEEEGLLLEGDVHGTGTITNQRAASGVGSHLTHYVDIMLT